MAIGIDMRWFADPAGWVCAACHGHCVDGLITADKEVLEVVRFMNCDMTKIDLVDGYQRTDITVADVLDAICRDGRKRVLLDLVTSDGLMLDDDETFPPRGTLTVIRRACARCTLCNGACQRTGEHILCCCGDMTHLWHIMPPERMSHGFDVIVQGYQNMTGIEHACHLFGQSAVDDNLEQISCEFSNEGGQ